MVSYFRFFILLIIANILLEKRIGRCGLCDGCVAQNCGKCIYCHDMKCFGGTGRKKKCCIHRKCQKLATPLKIESKEKVTQSYVCYVNPILQISFNQSDIIDGRSLKTTKSPVKVSPNDDSAHMICEHFYRLHLLHFLKKVDEWSLMSKQMEVACFILSRTSCLFHLTEIMIYDHFL